jgi:hypothetical protein
MLISGPRINNGRLAGINGCQWRLRGRLAVRQLA